MVITLPTDYKDTVSSQSPLSDLLKNTTTFSEVKNSLHAFNASLKDEMEIEEASNSAS